MARRRAKAGVRKAVRRKTARKAVRRKVARKAVRRKAIRRKIAAAMMGGEGMM